MPELRLQQEQYPLYSAEGRSFGFRTREAVVRLLEAKRVRPVYGRKGHLKAVYLPAEDGSHPVVRLRAGKKYSYQEHFECGTVAWALKRLGKDDEFRPVFPQAVKKRLAKSRRTRTPNDSSTSR